MRVRICWSKNNVRVLWFKVVFCLWDIKTYLNQIKFYHAHFVFSKWIEFLKPEPTSSERHYISSVAATLITANLCVVKENYFFKLEDISSGHDGETPPTIHRQASVSRLQLRSRWDVCFPPGQSWYLLRDYPPFTSPAVGQQHMFHASLKMQQPAAEPALYISRCWQLAAPFSPAQLHLSLHVLTVLVHVVGFTNTADRTNAHS